MTRRTAACLFFAAFAAHGAEQAQLLAGFHALYLLRFDEARETFRNWQRSHPADPMGHSAEAASHLFEEFEKDGVLTSEFFLDDDRLLGGIKDNPDAHRMRAFDEAIRRARELAAAQLARNPRDMNALLAMTMSTGMEADAASLIEKKHLEGLRLTREAQNYGKRLLALDPKMGDAYMPLGAANYVIGSLPAYKRALLWFGGIRGDRRKGMEQLAIAARDGLYLRAFAKVLLALACVREKRTSQARELLTGLVAEFPSNALFARELAVLNRSASAR